MTMLAVESTALRVAISKPGLMISQVDAGRQMLVKMMFCREVMIL
jgi:hypothetical protein